MVDDHLDLLTLELGFVRKSNQTEALEKLLFFKGDLFLCPTNRLWLFSIAIIIHIVHWYVQFLSNLQKHHSAVSYLNFVLHSEQTLVEKDSPDSLGTMKSSFSEGQTTLVVFNLF